MIDGALDLYIRPDVNPPNPLGIPTPEQLYPLTGVRSLYFNQSVNEGLQIMNNAIFAQVPNHVSTNSVTVFGVSQSAVMASLEMRALAAMDPATAPLASQLNFVLAGNEMNPNGGLLSRFPGLSMPSIGLDFYGSTPSDTIYPTSIYYAGIRRVRRLPEVPDQPACRSQRSRGHRRRTPHLFQFAAEPGG